MDMTQEKDQDKGHYHPLTIVTRELHRIFSDMGFEIADGPHILSEEANFDVINVPKDHPARDMHDTFWIKGRPGEVLRTHLSSMQVPYMKENELPLAMISTGPAYRYEATDATHESIFQYMEGLMVGKDISVSNLKGVLGNLFEKFFGKKVNVRLRPAYFPFVEPGFEVDFGCFKCEGKDKECSICRGTGWIELMGAGMVHPKVLLNAEIDHREWQGFAFGMGIDRLAMLKYGINDVRLSRSGDLRFTNQF